MDTILIGAIVSAFFALIVGVVILSIEHLILIPWREKSKAIAQSDASVSRATLDDVIQNSFPEETQVFSELNVNDDLINLIEKVVGPVDAIATPKFDPGLVIQATVRFLTILLVVALLGGWVISLYDRNQKFLKSSVPIKATIIDKDEIVKPLPADQDSSVESLTPRPTSTPQRNYYVVYEYYARDSSGDSKTYSVTWSINQAKFDSLQIGDQLDLRYLPESPGVVRFEEEYDMTTGVSLAVIVWIIVTPTLLVYQYGFIKRLINSFKLKTDGKSTKGRIILQDQNAKTVDFLFEASSGTGTKTLFKIKQKVAMTDSKRNYTNKVVPISYLRSNPLICRAILK